MRLDMYEFLFLILPLIAVVSFFLGYVFKGSFSAWLLKRRTKQSYLDEVKTIVKDDSSQSQEVVNRLLDTVEYIIDGNLIANAPPVQKLNKNGKATIFSKSKEASTRVNSESYPEVDLAIDDFYEQIAQTPVSKKEEVVAPQEEQSNIEATIEALDNELKGQNLNNPIVSTLENALQNQAQKRATKVVEESEEKILASRSLKDLQHPYGVLAEDVGHLLEMQMLGGVICMQRGDYFRAIKIFRHILAIPTWKNQGHVLANINLARCYLKAGMYSRALETLLPQVGNVKYEGEILNLLLEIYIVTQDWKPALAVAKAIYSLQKNNNNLKQLCNFYIFRLCSCYLDIGHRRTMFSFQRIIELDPTNVRVYVTRANYHFALGDYLSALEDYQQALNLRFELLPAVISNIAYCYANIRTFGNDFAKFLQSLEVPEKWQYILDLYLDQVIDNFDFLPYAHSYEFRDQAKSSAEVFRELVLGQKTTQMRDFKAELAQKAKMYQQGERKFIGNLVSFLSESRIESKPELYDRLEVLLESYKANPQAIVLERIFMLLSELLVELPVEVAETKQTKSNLLSLLLRFGNRQQAVAQNQTEKFEQFLTKLDENTRNARIVASYHCSSCGYQHHELFWLCPSCHKLETFALSKVEFTQKKPLD
ncbi:hypothetical protein CKF54_04315 [Psittacicella hinzii]|uniref:Rubredoxin-like domain-containing protein n=1 Tax=Psittacicella hinzii TaxID=2028575 RepID=A0A3A1Y5X9_9GAMM|nr:tetratricopeptide repeat protein [Psittacicella hinzii]RIY32686.1 hypothetical protein CKF54_04315 [Psittacicella hinzii]